MDTTHISLTTGLSIIVGLLLVFIGRRIFWIFVGGMGFLAGLHFAPIIAPNQPQWVVLLAGIVLGIIGAVFAIVLQRLAVAVAGWFAGGMLATRLAFALGWSNQTFPWIAFIVGAIIAAVIVSLLFDWALIVLTTLTGAVMVCDALPIAAHVEWIIGAALVALGMAVQAWDMLRSQGPSAPGR